MNLHEEIEKSFPKIEKLMSNAMLNKFAETPVWELEKYNLGLGTLVRLRLLNSGSSLYKSFCEAGYKDKYIMTHSLFLAFHEHIVVRLASFSS